MSALLGTTSVFQAASQDSAASQDGSFRISCLIKKANKRKHNSHEWFMNAFAKELDCKYIFCTDCSTVFDSQMLTKLTRHLETHAETTAVCGRQRVMSVYLQNSGTGKPRTGELFSAPTEWCLRQVQTYDFEADHPVSKAAFDFLGWLPVLPGPCGMYRYKDMSAESRHAPMSRRSKYFELVNRPAMECGLVLTNLKIAEDRIPSLYAVFHETDAFKTHWVHDAVFYFEAETDLKALVLQRRRWLNGTNAGYVHIMLNINKYIWSSQHSFFMKLFTTTMLSMQLLQIAVLSLGPSIFASILFAVLYFAFTPACPFVEVSRRGIAVIQNCMSCHATASFGNIAEVPQDQLSDLVTNIEGNMTACNMQATCNISLATCTDKCADAMIAFQKCKYATGVNHSILRQLANLIESWVPSYRPDYQGETPWAKLYKSVFPEEMSNAILPKTCSQDMQDRNGAASQELLGTNANVVTTDMQILAAGIGMGLYLLLYLVFLWVHRVQYSRTKMRGGQVVTKRSKTTDDEGRQSYQELPVKETSMFPSGPRWGKQGGSEYRPWAWKMATITNALVVMAFMGSLYHQRGEVTGAVEKILFRLTQSTYLKDKDGQPIGDYTHTFAQGANCYDKQNNPFWKLVATGDLGPCPYGTGDLGQCPYGDVRALKVGLDNVIGKPVLTADDILSTVDSLSFATVPTTIKQHPFTVIGDVGNPIKNTEKYVLVFTANIHIHDNVTLGKRYKFSLNSTGSSMLYFQFHGQYPQLIVNNTIQKCSSGSQSPQEGYVPIPTDIAITQTYHKVIVVYYLDGTDGANFELKWNGHGGHGVPGPDLETVSTDTWQTDDHWDVQAYQASCYHWLSDETETAHIPLEARRIDTGDEFISQKTPMWIESAYEKVCLRDGDFSWNQPCTKFDQLYYIPKVALRCGQPAAHVSEHSSTVQGQRKYWNTAFQNAGSSCGVNCMPGHWECPTPCDQNGGNAKGNCYECVDLSARTEVFPPDGYCSVPESNVIAEVKQTFKPTAQGPRSCITYDSASISKCAAADDKPFEHLLLFIILNVYVIVPLLFSFVDAPFSRSLKSPMLLMRSAIAYIVFMPTFVAWFSAYSTNRLADVTWGNRGEAGMEEGELKIAKKALLISGLVVVANLAFAVTTAWLRTLEDQTPIKYMSGGIMIVAGYQFVVSIISYVARAFKAIVGSQATFGDTSDNTGLGVEDERASFARTTNAWRKTRAPKRTVQQAAEPTQENAHNIEMTEMRST
eukprot:SAG31_NODE_2504_length_5592_cov_3.052977_4_plen_1247_part_00